MNHRNMVLPQHEHGSNIIKHHEISKHRAMGSREAPHLSRRRQDGQASDAHLVDNENPENQEMHRDAGETWGNL